jgi:hypothetical protein
LQTGLVLPSELESLLTEEAGSPEFDSSLGTRDVSKLLVVLGMHRSGTSALTEALVRAGAYFGNPELAIGNRTANSLGLAERRDVVTLSEQTLRRMGCSWHDVYGFRADSSTPVAARFRDRFANDVLSDLSKRPVSIVKDPRLCLLLPMLRPALPDFVSIIVVRHPVEVAMSLAERNGFPLPLGIALWESYNSHALRGASDSPAILVRHSELMRQAPTTLGRVARELGAFGVTGLDVRAAGDAIDGSLHRQRSENAEECALSGGQQSLWEALGQAHMLQDVPLNEISVESREALRLHHEQVARRAARSAARARGSVL